MNRKGKIDERFQDTYDKLIEIRNQLDRLTMTQAWSLRETDLYMWQRKLDRIDDSRRDGNFFDAEGRPADLHAQRVSLLALHRRSKSKTFEPDTIVSHPTRIRIHISTINRLGTRFRSPTSHLQPTSHLAQMFSRSQEGGWSIQPS